MNHRPAHYARIALRAAGFCLAAVSAAASVAALAGAGDRFMHDAAAAIVALAIPTLAAMAVDELLRHRGPQTPLNDDTDHDDERH